MKINFILIISFIVLITSFSCGRRNMGYGTTQQYYPQGFYYGNHFYDPMFYSFIPRGNRIIVIDNRTEQQVAAPRRGQVQEVTDQNAVRQPQKDTRQRVGEGQRTDTRTGQPTDTQRRRQDDTQRSGQTETRRREQATPPRDTRRSSPNVNQQPTQRSQQRTSPPQTRPQNRSTDGATGGARPGSRR
ncbi:hypothetical protein BH23BAC1_BH23BAC1_48140 [soil metagenome]